MSFIEKNKVQIGIVITFVLAGLIVLIFSSKNEEFKIENIEFLKDYKVNEVTPIYVNDDDLAKKYLVNFNNIMLSDIATAYDMLEDECRDVRFGSMSSFMGYINDKKNNGRISYSIKEYGYKVENGNTILQIIDTNNEEFDFIIYGIMDYKVAIK